MKTTPIKRAEQLKPISREHHHGLLLCWKIRTGIKKQVEPARMKRYADWFFAEHLLPHFEVEEKTMFPVLGNENRLVKKALSEHRRLKRLFEKKEEELKNLSLIEEQLEKHIRFEERVLFNAIQEQATEDQLLSIHIHHTDKKFEDNLSDRFWE